MGNNEEISNVSSVVTILFKGELSSKGPVPTLVQFLTKFFDERKILASICVISVSAKVSEIEARIFVSDLLFLKGLYKEPLIKAIVNSTNNKNKREEGSDIKVIHLSDGVSKRDERKLKKCGIKHFITTPFENESLELISRFVG